MDATMASFSSSDKKFTADAMLVRIVL